MGEYISAVDKQCKVHFPAFVEAIHVHQNWITQDIRLSDALDEFDRYKVWAANVGAAHSGASYMKSLDYRLREAQYYKEKVSRVRVQISVLFDFIFAPILKTLLW